MKPLPFAPDAHPAVIVPVQAATIAELQEKLGRISQAPGVDVLEWRVDRFLTSFSAQGELSTDDEASARLLQPEEVPSRDSLARAFELIQGTGLPVMATVRTATEGGEIAFADVPEDEPTLYERLIREVIALQPAAVDIEANRWGVEAAIAQAQELQVHTVLSQHDWGAAPSVSDTYYNFERLAKLGGDVVKLAITTSSFDETLDLMSATLSADSELNVPVIGIAMGEYGLASRIMGYEFGSAATFAAFDEPSAPGQLSLAQTTAIFAQLPEAISRAQQNW